MSRYKAYPEYRDSGVEWLGAIPSQWEISPLKYLATFTGGGTPSKDNPDFWDGNIPWVSPKDMKTPRLSTTIDNITDSAIKQSNTNLLEKGALLMVVRSGILQHSIPVAINDVPMSLNQDMKALRFSAPRLSEYAFYFVEGNQSRLLLEWSKEGATVESIEHEFLANTLFPCPPLSERIAIIAFLDHETAKIDVLIEKQQRLIELLKEKRQAVISHAVTKGLNPNAPMKNSGVEWVNAVPTHWRVSKLSYHASVSNGATPSRENMLFWENGTIGWLNSSKVNDELIEEADQFITDLALSKTSVKPVKKGDLVMAITGEGQTRGRVAICNIDATINQHLASISTYDKLLNHKFLYLWLEGNYERIRYESEGAGSTKGAITCSEIGAFPVILPPFEEQDQIVSYVAKRKRELDGLERKANSAIDLMQERRTALISAAVTGKIDVRDWQAAA